MADKFGSGDWDIKHRTHDQKVCNQFPQWEELKRICRKHHDPEFGKMGGFINDVWAACVERKTCAQLMVPIWLPTESFQDWLSAERALAAQPALALGGGDAASSSAGDTTVGLGGGSGEELPELNPKMTREQREEMLRRVAEEPLCRGKLTEEEDSEAA